MMIKRYLKLLLLSYSLFLLPIIVVKASSVNLELTSKNEVIVDEAIDIIFSVNNILDETGIAGIGGEIVYDSNYLEFVSYKSLGIFDIVYSKKSSMFSGISMDIESRIKENSKLLKLTFKAKKVGETTIMIKDSEVSNGEAKIIASNNPFKDITISNKLDNDTNLKNLSIGNINLNFSPDITDYQIKVKENITKIDIDGEANSRNANVFGLGSFDLKYGSNNFDITVNAMNGDIKIYRIKVIREEKKLNNNVNNSINSNNKPNNNIDNNIINESDIPNSSNNKITKVLSTDNSLKNLIVNGNMTPTFNKDITEYQVSLSSTTKKLEVNPLVNDTKAKTEIIGDLELKEGETKEVYVEVTAENNNIRHYKLVVKRDINIINEELNNENSNKEITNNNPLSKDLFHLLLDLMVKVVRE